MSSVNVKLKDFGFGADGAVEIKSPELATALIKDTDAARKLIGAVSLDDISIGQFGEVRVKNKDFAKSVKDMIDGLDSFDELAVKNGACGAGC